MDQSSMHPLTDRQRQVLALITNGLSNKEIALRLGLSPKTIETHTSHAMMKLGVSNRTAAAVAFVEGRLLLGD